MIRYQSGGASPIIELTVNGPITQRDVEDAAARLRSDIELHGRTKVIEVIEHLGPIEPAAMWADLKLAGPLINRVTHAALVADEAWIRALSGFLRLFIKADLRAFPPEQLAAARAWIEAA